jgi:hypothetical protein
MIPQVKQQDILRSGQFVEQEMDIAQGQKAWIFDILRNKTYKDKIGSPFREYVLNAIDEHTKLGKSDIPVCIALPTTFSNELRIRDFGKGLSDADVIRFFANYGESDKRQSNDLIGAFGIGCASAFAYTDSFTIVSYLNGVQTSFNMYIDETRVGKIARLTSSPTKEPNGVEIVIPVLTQDINTFVQRGLALVKYFDTIPVFKNLTGTPDFTRETPVLSGTNWRYFGDQRTSILIQGQIGYPINKQLMGPVDNTNGVAAQGHISRWEYSLLESGLEIDVPIGTVELTASREELEMSEFTIKAIRLRLAQIRDELATHVAETFKNAKTIVEAKTAYYNFFKRGGSYGSTLQNSIGVIEWQGLTIENNAITLKENHRILQYTKKPNGDIALTSLNKFQCSDELNLFYDDTDRKKFMYRRRAKTLLDGGARQVTVLQSDDTAALLAETGVNASDLRKYSTVTPTILASTRLGTGNGPDATKRVKHKVKVFQLNWEDLKNTHHVRGTKSDYWTVAEIIPDTQVYVPIDRFVPDGMFDSDLNRMVKGLQDLALTGVDVATTPIYGIKAGIDTANMVKLDEWYATRAKQVPNLDEQLAIIQDWETTGVDHFPIDPTLLDKGTLAHKYALAYAEAAKLMHNSSRWNRSEKVRAIFNIADVAGVEATNAGQLVQLSKDFMERYPMLKFLNSYEIERNVQKVVDYVKLVDEGR